MYHPTSDQQWEPVVVNGKQACKTGTCAVVQKRASTAKPTKALEKDLHTDPTQEAPEQKPLPKLSHEEKQKLIKARTEKKLSQAQLAQAINEQPSVIKDIEAGKVITKKEVLTKIGRVLGIKLQI